MGCKQTAQLAAGGPSSLHKSGRRHVNKADIAKRMADRWELPEPAAGAALDCMLDTIGEARAKGEDTQLAGFGVLP